MGHARPDPLFAAHLGQPREAVDNALDMLSALAAVDTMPRGDQRIERAGGFDVVLAAERLDHALDVASAPPLPAAHGSIPATS